MEDYPEPALFPEIPCPMCGHGINAAAEVNGLMVAPRDGDYSLCVDCCEPSIYAVGPFGTSLRRATAEERGTIFRDHGREIGLMQRVRRESRDPAKPPSRLGLEPHQLWVWMENATPPHWEVRGTGLNWRRDE